MARTHNPYQVIPLENEDVMNWALDTEILNNTKVDAIGQNVHWLNIKAIKVTKNVDGFYIKYGHTEYITFWCHSCQLESSTQTRKSS